MDHSFTTFVYLINRFPTSTSPKFTSPFHSLNNKLPDYTSLKTFGCSCFPHVRPYNKNKLHLRSIECVYLDIFTSHKGFKCLSKEGRVYISKDVVFNETHFSYSSFIQSPSRITKVGHLKFMPLPIIRGPTIGQLVPPSP